MKALVNVASLAALLASGATVALMGQQLLGMQSKLQAGASLKEVFCGTAPTASRPSSSATALPTTCCPMPGSTVETRIRPTSSLRRT